MTRGTRILLVSAISLMVIAAGGLGALTLIPAGPQITKSMTGAMSIAGAIGGPFTLTATDGRTVTDKTYHGKWQLIYFGYTSCPDACPTALNNMGLALDRLGAKAAAVQPIFITVDPKRDTREALADYLKSFNPRIVALTGTEDQIAAVVKEYRVYVSAHSEEGGDYSVDHSSLYYLINPDGKFVSVLHGALSGDEITDRLRDSMKHTV
jgi:protein SCO1/2